MEVFVARQPIFDRAERVAGYELLFRSSLMSSQAPRAPHYDMSSRLIVDTFLGIGLSRVTAGLPAYINCTRELLLSGALELLDPRQVVLEVLETTEIDDELVAACEHLAASGYRLALDDFVFRSEWEPLLRLAEVIKVDVLTHTGEALEELVDRLRSCNAYLLAEKVETREGYETCRRLGFDLFQGYHFSRPEMLSRRDLDVTQLKVLRLLNSVRDLAAPDATLEETFRSDVSLSYKLLRMANSAAVGANGIQSIGHAIRLLGRESLYRWLALMLVSSSRKRSGIDNELVYTILVRARMCELIGETTGQSARMGSLFLVGLFSQLDTLLGLEMEEALAHLVLSAEVREALIERSGPLAPVLELALAYEAGEWDRVQEFASEVGIRTTELPHQYLRAMAWAGEQLSGEEV